MSYDNVKPAFYEMFQPGMPWHAGSTGWTKAPYPGWGNNPNRVGPAYLAVNGLGAYYAEKPNLAIHGLGQKAAPDMRGVVIAMLAIAGAFTLGALVLAPKKRHAKNYRRNRRWSSKYKDSLPDSAFLYVEPGGEKVRVDGKTYTIPRSKRKFPYKNRRGDVDVPHLRNAISRAPQASIPKTTAKRVQRKARAILAREKAVA